MEYVRAIKDFSFHCPVFGEGRLDVGKVYYAYTKFAQDRAVDSVGTIVRQAHPPTLKRERVGDALADSSILLIHSGGYGDTVSVGILLKLLEKRYGARFSVCCHYEKYRDILCPMEFKGSWMAYPPEADSLKDYDYVLPDLSTLVVDKRQMIKHSVVSLLAEAFGVSCELKDVRYVVPGWAQQGMRLPSSKGIRLGLNFDSSSSLRNYPIDLQATLIECLSNLGFELYFVGKQSTEQNSRWLGDQIHDYTNRTSIPQLAALLEQLDFVLAVDSLTANLSGILGKRTLTLMSVTGDGVFDHYTSVASIGSKLDCSPCGSVLSKSPCPVGYPMCRAFYDPSIHPKVIVAKIVNLVAAAFKDMI